VNVKVKAWVAPDPEAGETLKAAGGGGGGVPGTVQVPTVAQPVPTLAVLNINIIVFLLPAKEGVKLAVSVI
jgi:hypothetical protein